jgi:thioredoxin 1
MATVALTASTLETAVLDNDIVLVDFWAAWCGPCRQFGPVFGVASEAHPDVVFGSVDTEAEPELARSVGITSIPTLMAFRGGVLVYAQPGALPAAGLERLIEAVRGLDMDDVLRQSAEQEPAGIDRTAARQ